MENVFRLIVRRPPEKLADDEIIQLERESELQRELIEARGADDPRAAMKAAADRYVKSGRYASSLAALFLGDPLASALADIAELAETPNQTRFKEIVEDRFGRTIDDVAADPKLLVDDERLADSLVAVKLLPSVQPKLDGRLAGALAVLAAIQRFANKEDKAIALLDAPLCLPQRIFPVPSGPRRSPGGGADHSREDLELHRKRLAQLHEAVTDLLAFDPADYVETVAVVAPAPAPALEPETMARAVRGEPGGVDAPPLPLQKTPAFVVKSEAYEALSATTRELVATLRVDPTRTPLDRSLQVIAQKLDQSAKRLADLETALAPVTRTALVGRAPVDVVWPPMHPWPPLPPPGEQPLEAVPTTHGTMRSVGVADLLVVKQQLVRYEPVDIAHVENVLEGEAKKRNHRRATMTEQLQLVETERTKEEERELETTDRYEMSRETQEVISEDKSLRTGLTVSGSYGPIVDFEASVEGAMEASRERATSHATSFSRSVTNRSSTRVGEKIRQLRSLRIVTSVEETNEHVLNNADGDEHVVGIYQWLNKIYEAQIYNYGLRAMFDFVVPEPAAFAIHALKSRHAGATSVVKPKDFALTPAQVNETNYHGFVRDWEATGVSPPPEPFVTIVKTFRGGPDSPDSPTRGGYVDGAELVIPEGYRAVFATATRHFNLWEQTATVDVTIGSRVARFQNDGNWTWSTGLDGEVANMVVAVKTFRTSTYVVNIEVKCQRTTRALDRWRAETHAALLEAYQRQRSAYEEKLAALAARAGVEIAGRNPHENRATELLELKKACISILTAQHFDLFGSVESGGDGIPQVDLDEIALEGPYLRFFEQAFEWQNASHVFYPYFWGHRSGWIERSLYADVDSEFAEFLRAGAARVVVPARPGFELAIDHFLATGELWAGGELPPIGSDLYVPIVAELAEQLGAPGSEVPQGKPWEVRVPTSLVLLRRTPTLPRWYKVEDGSWTPEEETA